jgi:hypothetical protein
MNQGVFDAQVRTPTGGQTGAIDFLYLDLEVCTRCIDTNANLEAALSEVSQILLAADVEVSVTKTLVQSEEQARALGFFSSPTIRLNGKDISPEFRESRCESCESCACNGMVNCRGWVFQANISIRCQLWLLHTVTPKPYFSQSMRFSQNSEARL